MYKLRKILIMVLALVFCFSLAAQATNMDVTLSVRQTSTTPEPNTIDNSNGNNVKETIGNLDPFLKYVTVTGFDPDLQPINISLKFQILNDSDVTWSDYHFGIYEAPSFSFNGVNYPITVSFVNASFDNSNLDALALTPTTLDFFTDDNDPNDFVADGDKFSPEVTIRLSGFPIFEEDGNSYTFTLSQRPTVVPIPGALLLLGSGLLGLVGLRRVKGGKIF